MKKVLVMMLFMVAVSLTAIVKAENTKAVFNVQPQMTSQSSENKIKTTIRFEKGVNEVVTDLQAQTVTVTYDPAKTDVEKLTEAFKNIGYTVTPACTAAPEACSGCKH